MRNKIMLLSVFILIISVLFTACKTNYNFISSTDDITQIEIINVSEDDIIVIKDIEDINMFIKDFNDIDCYIHFTDPIYTIWGKAIRVHYHNGDMEIITWETQRKNINGKAKYGYRYFDFDSFKNLIDKYSE